VKINIKRVLISGFVVWIVSAILGWLTCGWLFNWVYMIPPNIWKDPAIMFSVGSMVGSFALGLVIAMIFAGVFALLYKGLPGKGIKKGIFYGIIIWLVGALAGIASMPFYMTIATAVVVYWVIQALVLNIINGIIVAVIYKEKK